jgi:hypothetical protein
MDAPPALKEPPALVAKDCLCNPTCQCAPSCNCVSSEPTNYADLYARVSKGETFTLKADYIPGNPPGVYKCWLLNGKPTMQAVYSVAPAQACPGGRCNVR